MPRPCRGDRRAASAADPVAVRQLLPHRADTFIAGQGRPRATDCTAATPRNGPQENVAALRASLDPGNILVRDAEDTEDASTGSSQARSPTRSARPSAAC